MCPFRAPRAPPPLLGHDRISLTSASVPSLARLPLTLTVTSYKGPLRFCRVWPWITCPSRDPSITTAKALRPRNGTDLPAPEIRAGARGGEVRYSTDHSAFLLRLAGARCCCLQPEPDQCTTSTWSLRKKRKYVSAAVAGS